MHGDKLITKFDKKQTNWFFLAALEYSLANDECFQTEVKFRSLSANIDKYTEDRKSSSKSTLHKLMEYKLSPTLWK